MCNKIAILAGLLTLSLGASADDVYYRWSKSGNTSISSDCKTIHLDPGSSVYLTVKGPGKVTFSGKGSYDGFFFVDVDPNESWPAHATYIRSSGTYTVNFSGEGEHYLHWHTYASDHHGGGSGEITSITWKGSVVKYAALIEWNANGGTCGTTISHVKHGGAVSTLPSATKTGYTLDGWYTKKDGGVKISNSYTVSSDTAFYAHWTANKYTIIFNANGGEGGTSKSLTYNTTLGTLPEATRYDFDFGGWWTAASGGSAITSSTKVTGAATYYAHWIDPIPELSGTATDDMVGEALSGSADSRITSKITTLSSYNEYRQWIDGKGLSHKATKASPNAWLSYALDAPGLIAKTAALANEDIVIESIGASDATAGAFDLVVSIGEAEIGEDATSARLAEALGVVGATELDESKFSAERLTVTLERTDNGKAKATVVPEGSPFSFFMRVKIK